MATSPSSTVYGGQHDTKYVTFELLTHAAFVSDKIWGFTLEPGRGRQRRHASVAWAPPPTSCVGGGSPKMPPEKQRRWCRYRSLERILCVLGLSLGSRAFWAIVRFEKSRLLPPLLLLGATAGVRYATVCGRGRGWCPGRHSLRFTIYRVRRGRRQSSSSRRIAAGELAQGEHATSSYINS